MSRYMLISLTTYMCVLEPAGIHTEVLAGGDPLDRQEADIVRSTLKYRWNNRNNKRY